MLPERHRQVLLRRYGLGDDRPQTHEEIGRWLGVGEERSRQLEREALHRLREIAASPRREVASWPRREVASSPGSEFASPPLRAA